MTVMACAESLVQRPLFEPFHHCKACGERHSIAFGHGVVLGSTCSRISPPCSFLPLLFSSERVVLLAVARVLSDSIVFALVQLHFGPRDLWTRGLCTALLYFVFDSRIVRHELFLYLV